MKKFIVLLLIAILPSLVSAKQNGPTWDASGNVYKVTDGDTLKIKATDGNDYTLRILWLDTPEKYTTRFWYVECFGYESSAYAQKLIEDYGMMVYAEFYGDDKYNRDLAEVYLWSYTGAIFAEVMIRDGYWFVYKKWIKTKNYQKMIRAEQYAKRNRLWLWNSATCNGKRIPATNTWSTTWSGKIQATKKEDKKSIWLDFSDIMKKNSEISTANIEADKIREEEAKKYAEEQERKYQEYLKTVPSVSSSNGWVSSSTSNSSWYTCFTGPRWGRYHYSSSWNKVYSGCD